MTRIEHREFHRNLKKYTDELLQSDEKTRDTLVAIGTHTKDGKLTPEYSSGQTTTR